MVIKKRMNLIELVVVIGVISILLAIAVVNFLDLKKKSITTAMSQNISIIQGEVDTYYLKSEKYPIKNQNDLSLEHPQLIDINMLVKGGFQKKNLDTSKIKDQYYWVDVFGKVWGSTKNNLTSINLIEKGNSFLLEGFLGKGSSGYNLYEVSGYSSAKDLNSNLIAENTSQNRYYKLIQEYELKNQKETYIQHSFANSSAVYLFSSIDEYGLEAAPRGNFSTDSTFPAIIRGDGEYEFEIEGADIMYWIDFKTIEDTPGNSTIDYLFTVKNEDGEYSEEWTSDFFSLKPSKGIKVKVIMKSDKEGNKPSLYDIRVVFKYEDDLVENLNPPVIPKGNQDKASSCPPINISSDFSIYSKAFEVDQKGRMVFAFKVNDLEALKETVVPRAFMLNATFKTLKETYYISENGSSYVEYLDQDTKGKCMLITYDIEILGVKKDISEPIDSEKLCGNGGSTNYTANGSATIVFETYLAKGQFLTKIERPLNPPKWILKSISIEVSHKGADYEKVSSLSEIKDESCVNFVYKYTYPLGYSEAGPTSPVIETCKGAGCQPPVCSENCQPVCSDCDNTSKPSAEETWCDLNPEKCKPVTCVDFNGECLPLPCTTDCLPSPPTGPEPTDKVLNDPEWTTVDRLRFFGHGAQGQLTRWYKAEHTDSIVDESSVEEISLGNNVRIVYRYAKSGGSLWSKEYVDFTDTKIASSVMAIAYVQVRTSKKDAILETDYPTVKSLKFYNEKGFLNMSMIMPTLTILATKDNNENREIYSNESNIKWSYEAADPRNKKITKVEWGGDIRDKYPVGTYEIKARVKNEVEIWSDWVVYELKVLEEKPVAKITFKTDKNEPFLSVGESIQWSLGESYDPDGDILVNSEWKNKKSTYPIGTHVISLRVQDSEGYWSDWVDFEITVGAKTNRVYRIETETNNPNHLLSSTVPSGYDRVAESPNYSGGKTIKTYHETEYLTYKFLGDGLDIKVMKSSGTGVFTIDKGTPNEKVYKTNKLEEHIYPIRNLSNEEHTLTINTDRFRLFVETDYINVYSAEDAPIIKNINSKVVETNKEGSLNLNEFSPNLNQSLNIYFTVLKDAVIDVSILDSKNNVETKTISSKAYEGGSTDTYVFNFNGFNSKGEVLNTGFYTVQFKAQGVNGSISTTNYSVYIDQEVSVYRIETETQNPVHLIDRNSPFNLRVINGATFSGGSSLMTYHDTEFSKYKIVGTGFDIKVNGSNTDAKIVLDEGTTEEKVYGYNSRNESILSVRNLENKAHTITIRSKGSNLFIQTDYIDVYNSDDKPVISNVSSKVIDKGVEGFVLRNDFVVSLNQLLKVNYQLFKDSNMRVEVVNSKGNIVRKELLEGVKKGGSTDSHSYIFDGKDNQGDLLPSGSYTLKLIAKGINAGAERVYAYEILISNDKPVYRIEAETSDRNILLDQLTHSSRFINSPSASGGKYLTIYHATEFSKFKINGSGFDIGFINSTTVTKIIVDEGLSSEKIYLMNPVASPTTFSIRNLEDKEHTLRIQGSTFNLLVNVDYIDVISGIGKPQIENFKYSIVTPGYTLPSLMNSFSSLKDQVYKIDYALIQDSNLEVTVTNASGKELNKESFALKGGTSGTHSYSWNGKDSSQNALPFGFYKIQMKFTGIGTGAVTTINQTVYLENRSATVRIESEDINSPYVMKKASYIRVQSGSASLYSGGQFNQVCHATEFYIYKFTGTGFDIRLTQLTGTGTLILDEGLPTEKVLTISGSSFGYVSMHNLPRKEYTLKLRNNTAQQCVSYDYIDIYE